MQILFAYAFFTPQTLLYAEKQNQSDANVLQRSGCNHPLRAARSGKIKANKTTPNNPSMNPFVLIQFPNGKLAAVASDGGRGRLENCSLGDAFISEENQWLESGIGSFQERVNSGG